MLCNICGNKEATIHLTEIVNDQMIELHLCETCASEKENESKSQFSFQDLLSGLSDFVSVDEEEKQGTLCCSECKMTYAEFGKGGKLGCPDCYQAFYKKLTPLIKRVQKGSQHVGKKPKSVGPALVAEINLKDLRKRLERSIENEEFEQAAKIRDEIKQLETRSKKSSRKKKA